MSTLHFHVQLQLLTTEASGKANSIRGDYRPSWNLGNQWLGRPMLNDGRILFEDGMELAPGMTGLARLQPLVPEFWGQVVVGAVLPMQEGGRVVGHATILAIVR